MIVVFNQHFNKVKSYKKLKLRLSESNKVLQKTSSDGIYYH